MSIAEFTRVIRQLPAGQVRIDKRVWYRTQKQHWLGWLEEYHTPGAYGRRIDRRRDARYAYNHVVEPKLLLYLIRAVGFPRGVLSAAQRAVQAGGAKQRQSKEIRKSVPWEEMAKAISKRKQRSGTSS